MASLLVVSGTSAGDFYLLGAETVEIGRDDACPIQIVDTAVSRRHLRIRFDAVDNAYLARDLGSANGTSVNDQRLTDEAHLADGDLIRIGTTELMFSAIDFADGETAFQHYRKRGENARSTVLRKGDQAETPATGDP